MDRSLPVFPSDAATVTTREGSSLAVKGEERQFGFAHFRSMHESRQSRESLATTEACQRTCDGLRPRPERIAQREAICPPVPYLPTTCRRLCSRVHRDQVTTSTESTSDLFVQHSHHPLPRSKYPSALSRSHSPPSFTTPQLFPNQASVYSREILIPFTWLMLGVSS
jgi:hypothetical protein